MSAIIPVRWGVLGTAKITEKVAPAIQAAPNCELVAIASRDSAKADAWAERYGVKSRHDSYQALLDDPGIEAVYIPLPTSLHKPWTIAAAKAGKHVLCEKPLAWNASEVREMTAACEQANVQLMDGTFWVHHPRAAAMKHSIANGDLGELRRVNAAFTFCWDCVPVDNIRLRPELGGGSLGDLGWYCVRAALWAFDEMPIRVFATARYEYGVDFNLSATLWFSGKRMASFDCGFDTVLRQWIEVAGVKASLVCDDFVLARTTDKSRYYLHGEDGSGTAVETAGCVQQQRMVENFAGIVRSGKIEPRWSAEALATMQVLDAIAKAARSESIVEIA